MGVCRGLLCRGRDVRSRSAARLPRGPQLQQLAPCRHTVSAYGCAERQQWLYAPGKLVSDRTFGQPIPSLPNSAPARTARRRPAQRPAADRLRKAGMPSISMVSGTTKGRPLHNTDRGRRYSQPGLAPGPDARHAQGKVPMPQPPARNASARWARSGRACPMPSGGTSKQHRRYQQVGDAVDSRTISSRRPAGGFHGVLLAGMESGRCQQNPSASRRAQCTQGWLRRPARLAVRGHDQRPPSPANHEASVEACCPTPQVVPHLQRRNEPDAKSSLNVSRGLGQFVLRRSETRHDRALAHSRVRRRSPWPR